LNVKPNHNNNNLYTAVPAQTSSSFSSVPNSSVSNLKNNFQIHDSNNNNRITVSSFSSAPSATSFSSSKKNLNTVTFAQPNYNNDKDEFTLNNSVNLAKTLSSTDNSSYPIYDNTHLVEPNLLSNNVLNNGNEETIVDTLEESSNTLADASALNHTFASSDDNKYENVESEPFDEVVNDNDESVPPPTVAAAVTSTSFAIAQTNDDTVAVEPTEFSSSISNNETINTIINLNQNIQLRDDDEQSTVIEDGSSLSTPNNQPDQASSEVSTTTLHETIKDLNNNGIEEHTTTTIKTTTSTFESSVQNENSELNQLIKEIETSSSNDNHHEQNESNNAQDEEHIETSEF
jgi:hypothetical protein